MLQACGNLGASMQLRAQRIQLPNMGWRPRDYQQSFWDAWQKEDCKRLIGVWHRRAGKDDVCLHGTAIKLHERVGTYWHCLPEYAQAKKAIWNAVNVHTGKRRIDEAFPPELVASRNDTEMLIKFKNGSTWQVIGSDRYNALVGAGVAGVTFSEWALANPSAWAYIRPMLVENDGWAAFITTPRGQNHAFSMYNRGLKSDLWFSQLLDVYETGAVKKADLVEALEEYKSIYGEDFGTAVYEQEYECSFTAAIMGAFYAVEIRRLRNEGRITEECIAIDGKEVHRVWDIGVNDDTSIWWFQVQAGQPVILDCYSASGYGVDHYKEVCDERAEKYGWKQGKDWVPHDAKQRQWVLAGANTIMQAMQDAGMTPQLAPNVSKLAGISAARETLRRAAFHPRCEDVGIGALENYRRDWDDDKKTFKKTEVHDWASHLADAFRYLSLVWKPEIAVKAVVEQQQARDPLAGGVVLPPPPSGRGFGQKRLPR